MKKISLEKRKRVEEIRKTLKEGDVVTHTRCMGCIEEHKFSGWDGNWIIGIPTADTMIIENLEGEPEENEVNDISPGNVTHINRTPVESVQLLIK